MSAKHPIIAVTGSSGAGTTSVTRTFNWIFRRERINAVLVEGDSFHRYDREEMKQKMAEAAARGDQHFSHFGPANNLFEELEELFRGYGESGPRQDPPLPAQREGGGALQAGAGHIHRVAGRFPKDTDLLFYEGLHGAVVTPEVNVARHADLIIGVVPIINLEWIQKLHRDQETRGYSTEAVVDTILRRMPDYVNYICPQFSQTHINFQRVPTVDTSNPFTARYIPTADESFVVIRFTNPEGNRFSVSAVDGSRLVHVAAQYHRVPGRQDGAGDAAHPDADDPEAHGCAPPRAGAQPARVPMEPA